ncbi:hypothetical protein MRB53_038193 [Persea americana]|nr:hypothetical protein MRB53_038193 [Persea americana]
MLCSRLRTSTRRRQRNCSRRALRTFLLSAVQHVRLTEMMWWDVVTVFLRDDVLAGLDSVKIASTRPSMSIGGDMSTGTVTSPNMAAGAKRDADGDAAETRAVLGCYRPDFLWLERERQRERRASMTRSDVAMATASTRNGIVELGEQRCVPEDVEGDGREAFSSPGIRTRLRLPGPNCTRGTPSGRPCLCRFRLCRDCGRLRPCVFTGELVHSRVGFFLLALAIVQISTVLDSIVLSSAFVFVFSCPLHQRPPHRHCRPLPHSSFSLPPHVRFSSSHQNRGVAPPPLRFPARRPSMKSSSSPSPFSAVLGGIFVAYVVARSRTRARQFAAPSTRRRWRHARLARSIPGALSQWQCSCGTINSASGRDGALLLDNALLVRIGLALAALRALDAAARDERLERVNHVRGHVGRCCDSAGFFHVGYRGEETGWQARFAGTGLHGPALYFFVPADHRLGDLGEDV